MAIDETAVLVVGDLHLYDKEMVSTKGYVKSNEVMLDNLYQHILDNPHIKLVIFEGDIQHKTPIKIRETHKWRTWFRKLGQLMLERLDESGLDVQEIQRDELDSIEVDFSYPVYSLRGNHDVEVSNRSSKNFTFFDELLYEGLLKNPKGLVINDSIYIDFRNYGEADRFPDPLVTQNKRVMGVFHDTIYHTESPSYIGLLRDVSPDSAYDGHFNFKGLDLALAGHIHTPEPLVNVETESGVVPYLQNGSMARTSFGGDNVRDVGYSVEVRLEDFNLNRIEIPILPVDEYFNLQRLANRNRNTPNYNDFNLDMAEVEDTTYSVEEAIRAMEGVPSAVKETALELLQFEQ